MNDMRQHLKFDGQQYRLKNDKQRLAAAIATLQFIAHFPSIYHSFGPEYHRDEMQKQARELLRQLSESLEVK